MKEEYDFSNGIKGKFYNKNANFNLPIYLEPELESFFIKLANNKNIELNQIVNNILRKDKEILELYNPEQTISLNS
jgi:hypothetical protein